MALTEAQQAIKAKNIIETLELDTTLNNLQGVINKLFSDAPIEVAQATSKAEVEELISSIKAGTATNDKIARFLSIVQQLGFH